MSINDQPPSALDPQDPFTALGKELEGTLRIGIDTIAKGTGISQD
ncbi:MAG: hypothetical protein VKN60_05990 [Cyanobacteriota bacterium]|nr:hypothetical protein [Cyanobacteriota bacterium]